MAGADGSPAQPEGASSNNPCKLPKAVGVLPQPSISEHQYNDSDVTRKLCAISCNCQPQEVSCIPAIYRVWHFYLEPCFALSGAYQLHWDPEAYFAFMPATAQYSERSQLICDQLAAAYVFFAVIEGLVLRTTNDIQVWRTIIFALLVCDIGHLCATWTEMGRQDMLSPWSWRAIDGVTMFTFVAPFMLRVAFLLEVGLRKEGLKKKA